MFAAAPLLMMMAPEFSLVAPNLPDPKITAYQPGVRVSDSGPDTFSESLTGGRVIRVVPSTFGPDRSNGDGGSVGPVTLTIAPKTSLFPLAIELIKWPPMSLTCAGEAKKKLTPEKKLELLLMKE